MGVAAAQYDALETNCTRLVGKYLIPGAGHWVQQERPTEVNELLTRFLTAQVATRAMT
jgi:pimeloyl-ACP methyl ester carboxylesterase